jgi:hypothetical protein
VSNISTETREDVESCLDSVKCGFSDLAREVKESETRLNLRILQMENRLLSSILANRGELSPRSSSHQSPENLTNVTSSRSNGGLSQTFPDTPSTTPKDNSNHWTYGYTQDMDLNHLEKRQCFCHHVNRNLSLENSIESLPGSISTIYDSAMDSSTSGSSNLRLFDGSMGTFDFSDLSMPVAAPVYGEFNFSSMREKQLEDHSSIFALTPCGVHSRCGRGDNGKPSF